MICMATDIILGNLTQFYDQAPLGICSVRRDRRGHLEILYSNVVFNRMIARDASKYIVGLPLDTVWPSREIVRLVRRLRGATPPKTFSLPVGDDGDLQNRWVALSVATGEFNGEACFTLWATDVSANKEAETKLRQAVREGRRAGRNEIEFPRHHEPRNPHPNAGGIRLAGADCRGKTGR